MADPELYHQFKGHRDAITSVHFCPTKKRVVSSSMDQTIMMWNFASDAKAYRYTGHTDGVYDVQFSRTSHLVASASRDKTIRLWVADMKAELNMLQRYNRIKTEGFVQKIMNQFKR